MQQKSKLPRRSGKHPTVAELVRRYQDFLPPSVSTELALTAFPPPVPPAVAESDQDANLGPSIRRASRSKNRQKAPIKKSSMSDFEQSYAANIAPKYLTHRRVLGQMSQSRIPGPVPSSFDSRDSSRRTSPDKRPAVYKRNTGAATRGERITSSTMKSSAMVSAKNGKGRAVSGAPSKEKGQVSRPMSSAGGKQTYRKPVNMGPGKVSNIARHFERISKDSDRANRRYAVIRGRRARPVASARATVEIFESVREAIKDDSDLSDSSSEADDEDDGEDERPVTQDPSPVEPSASQGSPPAMSEGALQSLSSAGLPLSPTGNSNDALPSNVIYGSLPSSPTLPPITSHPETPTFSDTEIGQSGTERPSTILKALSGLWPQQLPPTWQRVDLEGDDPMADPEHIFRDSSMVVRTDEPTSIIALALK